MRSCSPGPTSSVRCGSRCGTRPTRRRTGWSPRAIPTSWPPPSPRPVRRPAAVLTRVEGVRGQWGTRSRAPTKTLHEHHREADMAKDKDTSDGSKDSSKIWSIFSLARRTDRRDRRTQEPDHGLAEGDRQEPAGQPRRPGRRPVGGGPVGHGQRHGGADRQDARDAQGRELLREVDRTPSSRAPEGRPGRQRADAHHLTALTPNATKGRPRPGAALRVRRESVALMRSRGRSASSRPRAGCGGAPGSSSCR